MVIGNYNFYNQFKENYLTWNNRVGFNTNIQIGNYTGYFQFLLHTTNLSDFFIDFGDDYGLQELTHLSGFLTKFLNKKNHPIF